MVLSNCILQQCTKNLQKTSVRESAPCHSEGPGESEILEIRIVHFLTAKHCQSGSSLCKIIQLFLEAPGEVFSAMSHVILIAWGSERLNFCMHLVK